MKLVNLVEKMGQLSFQSQRIRKIVQLAKMTPEIEVLWLYGSQARGNANEHSYYDLAVAFKQWEEGVIERRLRPELLAMEWQNKLKLKEAELSILDINIAPIPLAMAVLKAGYLLLSKNILRQFQEQQRIMSKWENDYLYHYVNTNIEHALQ